MADVTTKVLEVIVDNNRAVSAIAEYNRLIDEQKDKQKQLAEQYKKGEITQSDYQKALVQSREEVKAYTRSTQELSKEIQNNIKDAEEQDGSLRSLRAQLSNLTKEFDALSRAERNGEAGQAKMAEINRITNELKAAEEETQRFYRNVGNYPDVKPLEQQLGEIKKQLAQLKYEGQDNTEEFRALAEQASNMKDALADVEQQINATASDTKNLDTAIMGLSTVMGGLSIMSNIFADGSEEGKKFQAVIQKVQLVMTALAAVQTIQKNTQKQSLLYMAAEKVQLAAINTLKKLQTALTAKQTAATGAQTVAQTILNAVMNANPVFLLISAFAALAGGVALAAKAIGKSSDEMKAQQEAIKAAQKSLEEYKTTLGVTLDVLDKIGAADATKMRTQILGLKEAWDQAYGIYEKVKEAESGLFGDVDKINEAAEASNEAAKEFKDTMNNAKAAALAAAAMYDTKDLTEYEKHQKVVTQGVDDWVKVLNMLRNSNRITQEEYNKAEAQARLEEKKAHDEIAKAEKEAEKKKADEQKKAAEERAKAKKEAAKRELEILQEATDAQIALIKDDNEKALAEEESRHEAALRKLRTRLAEEKNLTAKERAALNQLIELEEKKHQQNLEKLDWEAKEQQLKDQVDLLKLRLEAAEDGSQAEYDLKVQQLQAERDLELANLELTEEQKALIKETYAEKEEALRKERAQAVRDKEMEEMRLFWENQINEAALNNQNTLELELEQRKAELDALHQMEGESDAEFKARQLEAQKAYVDAKKAIDDYELQVTEAKMDAISGMINGLGSVMEAFGEENKALAKASKVLALAEIAINTGKAIAAGVAQSQSLPFPGNIAAVATTITTVLANIASAITTVKSAKFATGGYVSGPGTGTSDSIPAQLSNGESVINARSTAMFGPLLSSLNQAGGGIAFNPAAGGSREGYEFLASAVAAGMKSVNLHVGIDEVTQVQDRVATINEISTIG
jgi:hypothetical protein